MSIWSPLWTTGLKVSTTSKQKTHKKNNGSPWDPSLSFALLLQADGPLQRLWSSHPWQPASLLLPPCLCSMTLLPFLNPVCDSLQRQLCVVTITPTCKWTAVSFIPCILLVWLAFQAGGTCRFCWFKNVKGRLDIDSLKPHWPHPPGKTLFWRMKMAPSSSSCLTRQIVRSKVQFDPCRSMMVNDGEAWKVKAPFLWMYFFLLIRVPAVIWARWFDGEQLLDYSHSDINQHIQKQKRLVSTTNIMTNSNTLVLKYY